MRVLIAEDEALAAERLADLICEAHPGARIAAIVDTVEGAVEWLGKGEVADLAFFDIQLADGASFDIFQQADVPCPVIFATAFDQYLMRAFKVNSIDYLLKPFNLEDVRQAFIKYEQLKRSMRAGAPDVSQLVQALQPLGKSYRQRFVVKTGPHLFSVRTSEIACFFTAHKTTWLALAQGGRKFTLDFTLEQLEEMLDPTAFFRANRQYIVHAESVRKATVYSGARLKIELANGEELVISRERVASFKMWMGG